MREVALTPKVSMQIIDGRFDAEIAFPARSMLTSGITMDCAKRANHPRSHWRSRPLFFTSSVAAGPARHMVGFHSPVYCAH